MAILVLIEDPAGEFGRFKLVGDFNYLLPKYFYQAGLGKILEAPKTL